MSDIDRATDRMMADRIAALGGGAVSPVRAAPADLDALKDPTQTSIAPSTRNPRSEELSFSPADEARDVAARLAAYSDRSLGVGGTPRSLSITDSFQIAQRSGPEYLSAEEDYLFSAISLLIEQHRWSPRLFNDTSLVFSGAGDEGSFDNALNLVNQLRATKRLPYGGEVEARWVWRAAEDLRSSVSNRYEQSSEFVLSASLPLLRGAGSVAREDLIQAERNVVYAARNFENFRRNYLVEIANDYFSLIQIRSQIGNQERQIESLRRFLDATQARVDAGRESLFRVAIVENQLLSGVASLASLRERYILQLDRFKVRLGLNPSEPVDIAPLAFELAEPEIDEVVASQLALEYRLDLQNQRDQVIDARRSISNARNNLLPDLDISGNVAVPTDPNTREGGIGFDPDYTRYTAGLDLSLPLDRRIEQLGLKRTTVQLERQLRNYQRARDEVVVTARNAVREIDRARFQLTLAERQVAINRERLREQRLKEDIVDPQDIVNSENELLRSENDRDQARTDLRNSILNYLRVTGQLRVASNGNFQPLPGMMLMAEDGALPDVPADAIENAPPPAPQGEGDPNEAGAPDQADAPRDGGEPQGGEPQGGEPPEGDGD
jgi:outer membrane protein TolC